jgi:hypothetical protein
MRLFLKKSKLHWTAKAQAESAAEARSAPETPMNLSEPGGDLPLHLAAATSPPRRKRAFTQPRHYNAVELMWRRKFPPPRLRFPL